MKSVLCASIAIRPGFRQLVGGMVWKVGNSGLVCLPRVRCFQKPYFCLWHIREPEMGHALPQPSTALHLACFQMSLAVSKSFHFCDHQEPWAWLFVEAADVWSWELGVLICGGLAIITMESFVHPTARRALMTPIPFGLLKSNLKTDNFYTFL